MNLVACEPYPHFGQRWSSEKLEILERYLAAYTRALKNAPSQRNPFQKLYIDAFAGAGYFQPRGMQADLNKLEGQLSFDLFRDEDVERFVEGSATRALQIDPPFQKYYFIEKNAAHVRDLHRLREEYPERAKDIRIIRGDANEVLLDLCKRINWRSSRAVLFLDPFGMQVKWSTLEVIAQTEAIDLWYLFPLGVGPHRLLKKDGEIENSHLKKLNELFGTEEWREAFYKAPRQSSLFSASANTHEREANFDAIEDFFIGRLKSIFPAVLDKPYRLYNKKKIPLYSFCFASANNGRGGEIALRIARHLANRKY